MWVSGSVYRPAGSVGWSAGSGRRPRPAGASATGYPYVPVAEHFGVAGDPRPRLPCPAAGRWVTLLTVGNCAVVSGDGVADDWITVPRVPELIGLHSRRSRPPQAHLPCEPQRKNDVRVENLQLGTTQRTERVMRSVALVRCQGTEELVDPVHRQCIHRFGATPAGKIVLSSAPRALK